MYLCFIKTLKHIKMKSKAFNVTYTKAIGGNGTLRVKAHNEDEALKNAKFLCFTGRDFRIECMNTKETTYFKGLVEWVEMVKGPSALEQMVADSSSIAGFMREYNEAYEAFWIKFTNMGHMAKSTYTEAIGIKVYHSILRDKINRSEMSKTVKMLEAAECTPEEISKLIHSVAGSAAQNSC